MDHDQFRLCGCGGCNCEISLKITKKTRGITNPVIPHGSCWKFVWDGLVKLASNQAVAIIKQGLLYFDSRRMSQEHGEFIAFAAQASFKSKGQGETQTECDVHTLYAIGT